MPARLTQDLRNTIQSLLQRGHLFSKTKSMYPRVGSSTLTRLRKLYCPKLLASPPGGRPKRLGDGPRATQEILRSMGEDMSISGICKSL
ncbi:hypothetical protein MAM1_0002c00183 [Mucor ambiguus]|uniref:Uncharacterized protein n=1 Tax=Mucor ambiguus TaxID=91626 RepID=A0A0C9LZP3_9FUNG|nr:hypothetical protein MAM1_0002c00183 [Mucor ambiguus]